MADLIQLRRDTASKWEQLNPILADGEMGIIKDVNGPTQNYKLGDGKTHWNDLPQRGFNGNIVNDFGYSENKVISQQAVTKRFEDTYNTLEDYIFIYPGGNFPIIKKTGTEGNTVYNITLNSGTYFIRCRNNATSFRIILDAPNNYTVNAGEMLVVNIIRGDNQSTIEVIPQTAVTNKSNKIILLNNMRVPQGQFETIINNDIKNSIENKINHLKSFSLIYTAGIFPIIEKQNDLSYNVTFPTNTYYLMGETGDIFKELIINNVTYNIPLGKMLVLNKSGKFSIISQTDSILEEQIILLNNTRAIYGDLETIITNEAYEKSKDLYDYRFQKIMSDCSFKTIIDKSNYKYVSALIKCNIFVDKEHLNDRIGIGVFSKKHTTTTNKAAFYLYDIETSNNICVIDFDSVKESGTNHIIGNYTKPGRINCWIDIVINWDLFQESTATTNPTIFFNVKDINSSEFKSTFGYGDVRITAPAEEYFTVDVNGVKQNNANDFIAIDKGAKNKDKIYKDTCHYVQPKSDKPVKLLILCHGGGQVITENSDMWYNYNNIGKIFNALGYAVLLTNGMPKEWADENGITIDRPCGNWMAIESVVKAYDYVVHKYNIDTNGCLVYGQSQGGMVAENIAELSGLPILGTVLESPAISMQYAQLFISWAAPCLQALYGFNSQETFSIEKCIGLDPFTRNVDSPIIMNGTTVGNLTIDIDKMKQKKYRVNTPLLIIRSLADTVISGMVMGAYAKAIRNAGGNCKLITYSNAAHSTIESTDIVGTINGLNIRASLYEIIVFLHRCGGCDYKNIKLNL